MGGIMLKRFINYSVWTILFAAAAMLFSGCGGQTSDAPSGSEITFSTGDVKIMDGTAKHTEDYYITIIVKNEEGIPLNNVELTITYPWAVPSVSALVQFYDDVTPVNSPMKVTTDENGAYLLHFKYETGTLEYLGSIVVVSGSSSASVKFEVDIPT
jgi:hypothetical protein